VTIARAGGGRKNLRATCCVAPRSARALVTEGPALVDIALDSGDGRMFDI